MFAVYSIEWRAVQAEYTPTHLQRRKVGAKQNNADTVLCRLLQMLGAIDIGQCE